MNISNNHQIYSLTRKSRCSWHHLHLPEPTITSIFYRLRFSSATHSSRKSKSLHHLHCMKRQSWVVHIITSISFCIKQKGWHQKLVAPCTRTLKAVKYPSKNTFWVAPFFPHSSSNYFTPKDHKWVNVRAGWESDKKADLSKPKHLQEKVSFDNFFTPFFWKLNFEIVKTFCLDIFKKILIIFQFKIAFHFEV